MQVWTSTGMVGTVNIDPSSVYGKHYAIPIMTVPDISFDPDDDDMVTEKTIDRLELEVGRRSHRIDDMELEMLGQNRLPDILKAYKIPENATMDKEVARCATIFTWRVFKVDPDQYERLFDLDIFEPV
jgi:hypothetical protein